MDTPPDGAGSTGPAAGPVVGIDVVDLTDPRCRGKSEDDRFADRVLAPAERAAVRAAADPDRHLWLVWAGKEAAFKAVTRLTGSPPVFRHAAFVVTVEPTPSSPSGAATTRTPGAAPFLSGPDAPDEVLAGRWRWKGRTGTLRWEVSASLIVALATGEGGLPAGLEAGAARLEAGDPGGFRHPPRDRCSAEARRHATREAARALGVEPTRIRIDTGEGPAGRAPPLVRLDGRPAPLEVTLSHHGRWVAWAVVPLQTTGP